MDSHIGLVKPENLHEQLQLPAAPAWRPEELGWRELDGLPGLRLLWQHDEDGDRFVFEVTPPGDVNPTLIPGASPELFKQIKAEDHRYPFLSKLIGHKATVKVLGLPNSG